MDLTLPVSHNSFHVVRLMPQSRVLGLGRRSQSDELSAPLAVGDVTGADVYSPPRSVSFLIFCVIDFFATHRTTLPGVCVIYDRCFEPKWGQLMGDKSGILASRNDAFEYNRAISLKTLKYLFSIGTSLNCDIPNQMIIFARGN